MDDGILTGLSEYGPRRKQRDSQQEDRRATMAKDGVTRQT